MGNLISVLYACLTLTLMNLAANHSNEENALSVLVDSDEAVKFFTEANYDDSKKALSFTTSEETVQIRVYDNLQSLVYQLPVHSEKIRIGKSLFAAGQYTLVFDVNGDRKMFISRLEVY